MCIERRPRWLRALALSLITSLPSIAISEPGPEGLTCLRVSEHDVEGAREQELRSLVLWLRSELDDFGSLVDLLQDPLLEICLAEQLFGMQGYFEVESNRIVLNGTLEPGLQRAVAIHELRHAQQNQMGICLDPALSMRSTARLVLAMEADASAIGAGVAWVLREAGEPGVWEALARWPGQAAVVAAFEAAIDRDGDFAQATAIAFAEWYEVDALRDVYYRAACSAYLDRQDRTHVIAGYGVIDEAAFQALCLLPDGTPYDCEEPDLDED